MYGFILLMQNVKQTKVYHQKAMWQLSPVHCSQITWFLWEEKEAFGFFPGICQIIQNERAEFAVRVKMASLKVQGDS